MAERPDGGWGWIIAIAAFFTLMIIDGVKYSFGIMFLELVDTFERSKSETSWIMSIQVGISLLSGPIVAALINRFGCKTIALAGTMASFTGFVSSAFVRSLYIMYISFGFLAGFGFGLMAIPAKVSLARYFDKRLAFASGIAAMGSGVGTLAFNPLSKILIDTYTWRGTLLIEAGIVLNGLACALIMIPPKKSPESLFLNKEKIKDTDENGISVPGVDRYRITPNSYSADAHKLRNGIYEHEDENRDNNTVSKTTHQAVKSLVDETNQMKNISSPHKNRHSLVLKDNESEFKQTYETDFDVTIPLMTDTHENDCTKINPGNDCKICEEFPTEIRDRKTSKRNSKEVRSIIENKKENKSTPGANEIKNHENEKTETENRRCFSIAPLKNPGFLCFLLSGILMEMSLNTPFTFLPDMMLRKGFEKQDAVLMLFIIGLVGTVSRILIGFIADLRFVNRVKLCNSIGVLNGIFVVLCPFCFNYASFVVFSVLFGFSAGSFCSLRYVLVPDLFGIEMIADLYGINMFFSAFAAFIGLPKAGALFDATGNYIVPFAVAGAELSLGGILQFLIPVAQRCKQAHLPNAS